MMDCSRVEMELPSLLSGELDGEVAEEIRAHIAECRVCEDRCISSECLASMLRDIPMETMPSGLESAVIEGLKRRRRRWGWIPASYGRRLVAVGASVVLVAMVVGAFLSKQEPLTAAQVLASAQSKLESIQSWHMRERGTDRLGDGSIRVSGGDRWWRYPDRFKLTGSINAGGGSERISELIAGDRRVMYWESEGVLSIGPTTEHERACTRRFRGDYPGMSTPEEVSRRLGAKARLAGTGTIAGRKCDMIEGTFPNGEGLTVAIDQESGMVLSRAFRDKEGREIGRVQAEAVEINSPIADEVFTLAIPKAVRVIRGPVGLYGRVTRSSRLMDPSEVDAELRRAREYTLLPSRTRSSLRRPGSVPGSYRLLAAVIWPERIHNPELMTLMYLDPVTGDTVVIGQRAKCPKVYTGREVRVGAATGKLADFTSPYPYSVLTWQNEGEWFTLTAGGLKSAEMTKIAESMAPVGASVLQQAVQGDRRRVTAEVTASGDQLRSVIEIVKSRLRALGIVGAAVDSPSPNRICVTAGTGDSRRIADVVFRQRSVRLIGVPGFLAVSGTPETGIRFTLPNGKPGDIDLWGHGQMLLTEKQMRLSDPSGEAGLLEVVVTDPRASERLRVFTKTHVGKYMAIALDDRIIAAPHIDEPLTDGRFVVRGPKDLPPELAAVLSSGPFPVNVRVVQEERVP